MDKSYNIEFKVYNVSWNFIVLHTNIFMYLLDGESELS